MRSTRARLVRFRCALLVRQKGRIRPELDDFVLSFRNMKVNTNLFAVVGAAYAIDCFFCLMVSRSSIRSILGALWALGPPANLIHGTDYLVPFALGTLV